MITGRAVGLESKKSDNKINSKKRGIFRIDAEIRRRICVAMREMSLFILPKGGNENIQHNSVLEENVS